MAASFNELLGMGPYLDRPHIAGSVPPPQKAERTRPDGVNFFQPLAPLSLLFEANTGSQNDDRRYSSYRKSEQWLSLADEYPCYKASSDALGVT